MATPLKPSEFGGHTMRNGIAPPRTPRGTIGHTIDRLSPEELLKLQYQTGQTEDSTLPPDNGEAFTGIEPYEIALGKAPKPRLWREDNEA